MLSRLCIILLVCVFKMTKAKAEDDTSVFTSPVLRRNKTNYLDFAGKTYYFGTVFKANFYRAMQFCRQQGMQLVSISTQAENDRIGRFVEEIGTNLADEYEWIWLSTGNNLIYTNWHPGKPSGKSWSNDTENCLEARHFGKGFTWNDLVCETELNFICESLDSCSK